MSAAFPPLAERYEAFLLDLDGVVYRGEQAVVGAAKTVEVLGERGRRVVFLTNNSSRLPEQVAEKLAGLGIPAAAEDVVVSSQAAATLIAREVGEGASAFVVGERGVVGALEAAGIEVVRGSPERVDVVVIGWDREADYAKLRDAAVLVRRGARLIATNTDASYPAPNGELWPGAGALVAAVETATGQRAMVAGKPEAPLFEAALERAGTASALVVGDRLETDLAGASAAGVDGAAVFSGAAGPASLVEHDVSPVAAMADLRGLLEPRPVVRVRPAEGADDEEAVRSLRSEAGLEPEGRDAATVVAEDGEVLAAAGVEVRSDQGYLHGVAVREDVRGLHVGTLVAAAALRRARASGAAGALLLTEDASGFFARLGFEPLERDALPGWVRERAVACSETATAMARPLR